MGLTGSPLVATFIHKRAVTAALQVAVMAVTLNAGWGVEGLLAGNAAVDLCISALLLISHIRSCGLRIDRTMFSRAAGYNLPLIGGSLAMFVLGSCDRWFLAGMTMDGVNPAAQLVWCGFLAIVSLAMLIAYRRAMKKPFERPVLKEFA